MGNINDYGLPQLKGLFGESEDDDTNNAVYLVCLAQAVKDVSAKRGESVTVVMTAPEEEGDEDNDYEVTPAPAESSILWNLYALRARHLYLLKDFREFLAQFKGLSVIGNETKRMSRDATIKARQEDLLMSGKEYKSAMLAYRNTDGGYYAGDLVTQEELDG